MSKIFMTLAMCLITVSVYSQTKTETIKWINQYFSGDRSGYTTKYYSFVCFTKVDLQGNITNTSYRRGAIIEGTDKDISTANFKNFSYSSVYTKKYDNVIFFYAKCFGGSNCVKNNSVNDFKITFENEILLGMISIEDYALDMEQRSIKAFQTAIKLYNNRKEAF